MNDNFDAFKEVESFFIARADFLKSVFSDMNRTVKAESIYFHDKSRPMFFAEKKWCRKNNTPGVYLIGDFYVGQSIKVRDRVKEHFNKWRRGYMWDNEDGWGRWNGIQIPVYYLDSNPENEYIWAYILKERCELPLLNRLSNCLGFDMYNLAMKEVDSFNYLTSLGYEINLRQGAYLNSYLINSNK